MDDCTPRCTASKLLILGIVLILIRNYYPQWDIWIVIGIIIIIKAMLLFIMPTCRYCNVDLIKNNEIKKSSVTLKKKK